MVETCIVKLMFVFQVDDTPIKCRWFELNMYVQFICDMRECIGSFSSILMVDNACERFR